MANWDTVCERLCKKLKKILDEAGVKESDWYEFFTGKYGDQIEEFVAEKAKEFRRAGAAEERGETGRRFRGYPCLD